MNVVVRKTSSSGLLENFHQHWRDVCNVFETERLGGRNFNMKRSNFGVVVFGVLTAIALLGTSPEPVALATPAGSVALPSQDVEGPSALTEPADKTIHASAGAKISVTPAPVNQTTGSCPAGMLEVEGDYCPYVEQKCLRWLDPETKMRCAEFAPSTTCASKTTHKKFCVDRYEYPNKPGEKPVIMKTWYEAKDTCQSIGKRLYEPAEYLVHSVVDDGLPWRASP
jgi:hypothetical protein